MSPPAAPSVVEAHPPPQRHHAPPPRTTTTPSDFCIGGCVWMGASMEWHRGGDTGFEGLVRAVQSTENAHFNEAAEPVVQDCGHSGEIPEG